MTEMVPAASSHDRRHDCPQSVAGGPWRSYVHAVAKFGRFFGRASYTCATGARRIAQHGADNASSAWLQASRGS